MSAGAKGGYFEEVLYGFLLSFYLTILGLCTKFTENLKISICTQTHYSSLSLLLCLG